MMNTTTTSQTNMSTSTSTSAVSQFITEAADLSTTALSLKTEFISMSNISVQTTSPTTTGRGHVTTTDSAVGLYIVAILSSTIIFVTVAILGYRFWKSRQPPRAPTVDYPIAPNYANFAIGSDHIYDYVDGDNLNPQTDSPPLPPMRNEQTNIAHSYQENNYYIDDVTCHPAILESTTVDTVPAQSDGKSTSAASIHNHSTGNVYYQCNFFNDPGHCPTSSSQKTRIKVGEKPLDKPLSEQSAHVVNESCEVYQPQTSEEYQSQQHRMASCLNGDSYPQLRGDDLHDYEYPSNIHLGASALPDQQRMDRLK